jgi:hypothetical protein
MKKCPPGVICLENFTIFLLLIIMCILFYIIFSKKTDSNINITNNLKDEDSREGSGFWFPSYNQPDVLLNPYAAPLRDERYFVPINVATTALDTTYRQIGIITPLTGSSKDNILPLMGRPLFTRRGLWQYYTISNQHNNVKLPVSVKGRSGLNDNGVDELFTSDHVYVEGYNEAFKVTKYENNTIKYLPF